MGVARPRVVAHVSARSTRGRRAAPTMDRVGWADTLAAAAVTAVGCSDHARVTPTDGGGGGGGSDQRSHTQQSNSAAPATTLTDALAALEAAGLAAFDELKRDGVVVGAPSPAQQLEAVAASVSRLLATWAHRTHTTQDGGVCREGHETIDSIPRAVVPTLRLLRNCCARGEGWQQCVLPMIPSLFDALERVTRDTALSLRDDTGDTGSAQRGRDDGGCAAGDAGFGPTTEEQHLLLKPCVQLLGNAVRVLVSLTSCCRCLSASTLSLHT